MNRRNSNLVAALAAALFASAATHGHAALVSHWTFDTNFADSASFANNGSTLDGDPAITGSALVGAGALELDGNDSLVLPGGSGAEYTSLDDDGNGFTVAAWVNMDSDAAGNQRILSMAMGAGFVPQAWGVGFTGDALLATTYGKADHPSGVSLTTGVWQHVAYRFEFNGTGQIDRVVFFLNGSSVATIDPGAEGLNNTTGVFTIGNINIPGNEQFFKGRIDELRVYDNEISNGQISAISNIPTPAALPAGLGMVMLALGRRRRC